MLRLILGDAGSGKTAACAREIAEKISRGERDIYMLVPEQYSHEAERTLASACGDSLSLGAEVTSFTTLARLMAQETGGLPATYLDGGGKLLALSLALRKIAPRLTVFALAAKNARLTKQLLQTLDELKSAGVTPESLEIAAQSAPRAQAQRLTELSLCLEANAAVKTAGQLPPEDALTRLAELLPRTSAGQRGQFYVDGFTDFTQPETAVLEALLRAGRGVTVCLTCDSLTSAAEHFAPSRRAANGLARFARKNGIAAETVFSESDGVKNPVLSFYNRHLFEYTTETVSDEHAAVTLLRAPDVRAECENAAALCLQKMRETGCRWREIAIAARGFEAYAAPLEDAFRLFGVPLFTARRGDILQKPLPAALSDVFRIIHGGWDSGETLAYLSSGLSGLSEQASDELAAYVSLWSLRGANTWQKAADWRGSPSGYGRQNPGDKEKLARINLARRQLSAPLTRLHKCGAEAQTAEAQAQALCGFMEEIGLAETLSRQAEALDERGFTQTADEFSQLWSLICRAIEQFSAMLGATPMTQDDFAELFRTMLGSYSVASIPLGFDCVTAGEIDRMRRRNIRHLIVLGASDDRFPAVRESFGLLTEEDRSALAALGFEKLESELALPRELSLIYNCVSLPSESLTLSYCASDSDGSTTRPSFLITRASLLTGAEIRDISPEVSRLASRGSAFLLACRGESAGAAERLAQDYFAASPRESAKLMALSRRADFTRGSLSKPCARQLYGRELRVSPSRADSFFSCRYSYFLRYGLRLSEGERASFDAPELGSFMHYVLEKCAAEILRSGGFAEASPEQISALADRYADEYAALRLGGLEDKSERFKYLFGRLRPSVRRVAADMARELKRSSFVPLRFEMAFGTPDGAPIPPLTDGETKLRLTGVADRVDGCLMGEKLLLRVVDYKTGKKSFSLSDVWYGLGMQMLLYLFALERSGKELFGREIIPAGVLYVPARDATIVSKIYLTDEALEKEKAKIAVRSGLILKDPAVFEAMERGESPQYLPLKYDKSGQLTSSSPVASREQLSALRGHVEARLLEFAKACSGGSIEAAPYYRGENDKACLYCPYTAICRFDETRDSVRRLMKIKPEEFWERLGGESHE
ncbi:MAG: PD-(D/E)XK nuclease family protein [Oscillospiraceae bacterium]|nr:PD-(D/E)XK nuclease family protein [Oscillospiraceae bacterium]